MTDRSHQFLWLDLETTGLEPTKDSILEFAVVLAADDHGGDMSPVEHYSGVLYYSADGPRGDDYVRQMHTKNGLWQECAASMVTITEVEDFLIEIVCDLGGPDVRGIVLAGASVHFDLRFLCVHMPRFAKRLSHRVLDVSSLTAAARAWGRGHAAVPRETHRALPDILATLADARRWRRQAGWMA